MKLIMENWRSFIYETTERYFPGGDQPKVDLKAQFGTRSPEEGKGLPPMGGNIEVYGPHENYPSHEQFAAALVRIVLQTQKGDGKHRELFERVGGFLFPFPWRKYFDRMLNSYERSRRAESGSEIDITNKQEVADWIHKESGVKVDVGDWSKVVEDGGQVMEWIRTTPRYAQMKEKWSLP